MCAVTNMNKRVQIKSKSKSKSKREKRKEENMEKLQALLSRSRPTTGTYYTSHVTTGMMTAEEKQARRDMIVTQESLRRANREFRDQERVLLQRKRDKEQAMLAMMRDQETFVVPVSAGDATQPGPKTQEVFMVKAKKRVTKALALGRIETFAAICPDTQQHAHLHATFEKVYAEL
jgi:hypothetical protein